MIELHGISTAPPELVLPKSKLIQLYQDMLVIRLMEIRLGQEYSESRIRGFCHLIVGQEGLYAVLKDILADDCIITSYRCHGAAYAGGISLREIICENLGTSDGCCKGKGGSMHLYGGKMYGGRGIVGAQVPLGAGLAFALKYRAYESKISSEEGSVVGNREGFLGHTSKGVCFCIFGDGASNQGQVYETYNMAKVYSLPIVFIIENNQYGMYTPVEDVTVDDSIFKHGYGIPGIRTRDTRIADVKRVLEFAREYSKSSGPIIVQIDTFRKCGHSTIDSTLFYMKQETVDENEKLDCLLNLKGELEGLMAMDELKMIEEEAERSVNEIFDSIDGGNEPTAEDLFTDLLAADNK